MSACIGYGLLLLAVSGVDRFLHNAFERLTAALVLGVGLLGWVLFFPGIFGALTPTVTWGLVIVGVVILIIRIDALKAVSKRTPFVPVEYLLLALLFFAAGMDFIEGTAPPVDADTLAYHFALPAQFVADGQIAFIPRAVSGAIPMLMHMTYAAAITTGGELALTLWAMLTGWAPGLLMYAIARRYIDRTWALALLAVFITTPAVLYGGGSGQIEIRCAAFALATVLFLLTAERRASYQALALAGLCAGFFIATKYYGLIFAGAAGLVVIYHRDGLRRGFVFAAAALVAGSQWYIWNYLHTGDPVFPMLTNMLQFSDSWIWTQEFGTYFSKTLALGELPLDRTLINWLLYPVYTTFNLVPALEGGRTGLGVLLILILPTAILGLIPKDPQRHHFLVPLIIVGIFYTVWFFSGTTQRTRHLLSVYPLLLFAMYPAAIAGVSKWRLQWPLAVGLGAIIVIQLAGQGVFTLNYAQHIYYGESRAAFFDRNVPGANSARWINQNLSEETKTGFMNRQLAYLIKRPAYMMHPHIQTLIDTRPTNVDAAKFAAQLRRQNLTHVLIPGDRKIPATTNIQGVPFFNMVGELAEIGCLKPIKGLDTLMIPSRTLKQFGGKVFQTRDWVFKIVFENCPGVS